MSNANEQPAADLNGDPQPHQWPTSATVRADRLVDQAAQAAHRMVDETAARVTPGVQKVAAGVERVADRVAAAQELPVDLLGDLREAVRERPLTFIAGAFFVGMLAVAMGRSSGEVDLRRR
ncbi:MAG TPA: hypothetical protein PKA20_11880 [Burkholderiaceae bacterium]|nr:hypothetical protein [Burkholderiaceae bacterium]